MKTAIVGSRNIIFENLEEFLPHGTTEIISGGAKGIDTCAEELGKRLGLKVTVIRPDYQRYGRSAPLRRNNIIIEEADMILAVWDGESKGTKYVIDKCTKLGKPLIIKMM